MNVGDRIRLRREFLGLTQEELAHKIGLKGKSSVARVEANGNDITTRNVTRYADALETTPSFLMGWEGLDDAYIEYMQSSSKRFDSYYNMYTEYFSEQQLKSLNKCIEKLNDEGIKKLLERAEELAEISKYVKEDSNDD